MNNYLRAFVLVLACVNVYGQSRLSPKFKNLNTRISDDALSFSISVKEPMLFLRRYHQKLKIKNTKDHTYHIVTTYNLIIDEMASDDNILFIDIVQKPNTEAGIDFVNPAFNRITKVHAVYNTLIGASENISIKENRFDVDNIDLLNRSFSTPLTPEEISQHATTMATLIAGGGNSSLKGLGVAPAAQITSSSFNNLLPDADEIFITNNIYLQNHSYGVLIENYYGNEAAAYDEQVINNPTLMHVFSAGNLGLSKPIDGTYANLPYANLSGNFKQAKNVILTTAVDTSFLVNTFNSKGPAYDGRLKPELAAYGQGGTSDAAALVTGISALIQEKYKLLHGSLPLASTIKATLIATADDIGPQGIDYTYGYGNVNAFKALQLLEGGNNSEVSVESNDVINIPITVSAEVAVLKVAVVWTDPPALQNSDAALVHDIDCELSDGNRMYDPWVLSSFPKSDSLSAKAKRKKDHLNNVEYFTIENPTVGNFTLTITAPALITSNQNISIAYWQEKKEFQWDYPMATDVLEAKQKHTLFWNYSGGNNGDLYLQLNDGDWHLLKSSIDLSTHYHWTAPDTLATAKLKMIIDGEDLITDAFLISQQLKLNVAFNCKNEFSLSWNNLKEAHTYEVSTMGEKYLEGVLDTTDTVVVFTKTDNKVYYSVAPKYKLFNGLKSQTINYEEQGAFCYINLFSAQRFESNTVTLQLKLSTVINVQEIRIFKTIDGTEALFISTQPTAATAYEFPDQDLSPGYNLYRAELILKNGTVIQSAISDVLIETPNKAILFPNPINDDEMLSVLTEGGGLTLEIVNDMGQKIIAVDLDLNMELIETRNFPAGIYLYTLKRANKTIDSGRFIKH
jgi:hypothetical protein